MPLLPKGMFNGVAKTNLQCVCLISLECYAVIISGLEVIELSSCITGYQILRFYFTRTEDKALAKITLHNFLN